MTKERGKDKASGKLLDKVLETIGDRNLLEPEPRVLVSVSGGPDSVALLHVLNALGYSLEVAHFDHQTREGKSTEDAEFVRALAQRLGLPVHTATSSTQKLARESSQSFEAFAREERYAFLTQTARDEGIEAVATGHTKDDQAETVLMRVLRGTSPRGAAGIPPKIERDGVRIVRPLIYVSHAELREYLETLGETYRLDATNEELHFLRNRIRHGLLPQLKSAYNPRLEEALCRLADAQYDENDVMKALTHTFVDDVVLGEGEIDRARFRDGHRALQRRAVLEIAWRFGAEPDFELVDGAAKFVAAGPTGKSFDLGGGVQLCNGRDATVVVVAEAEAGATNSFTVDFAIPGETRAFGKTFRAALLDEAPKGALSSYCTASRQVFDAQALSSGAVLRHRRPGDRIVPFGMKGHKKLKDYFNDLGVPPVQRDKEVLLVAGGDVIWVVGHAINARAAVTEETVRVLQVDVADEAE